jgi:hypothetical protein
LPSELEALAGRQRRGDGIDFLRKLLRDVIDA